jgi:hypothetical protein
MNMEAEYNERRSETTTLFLLKSLSENQSRISQTLQAHMVQEDLRFDQILREVHELRTARCRDSCMINPEPRMFLADLRPLKLMTAIGYALMAVSLFLYHPHTDIANDLLYMGSVMPIKMWSLLFFLVFFFRAAGLVSQVGARYLHLAVPIAGLWLWCMTLTSFAVLSHVESVGLLLSIPIIMEMWVLARSYARWRTPDGNAGNL